MTKSCQALCSWWINNVDPDESATDDWRQVTCQQCLANQDHKEANIPLNTLEIFKILVGIDT